MAFKSEEIKIDEYTFKITVVPYKIGRKVLDRASQLFTLKIADQGHFEDGASPLTASMFMKVPEEDMDFVLKNLADYTEVKQEGESYLPLSSQQEIIFPGRYDLMFRWLDKALEVNFSGPLGDLKRATLKDQTSQQKAPLKSRKA